MAQNTLAVCIIAKDEASSIARAIASVKPIADEVIVVDTGSTDNTPDIARSLGAKVVRHVWEDDFSKARNAAIEAATCEWILFLDADETVCEESLDEVRSAISGDADAFFVRIESRVRSQAGKTFVNSFPRLFRRLPGVEFEGRVHEQVLPSLQRVGARIAHSNIVIRHAGYDLTKEEMAEKLWRNCRLLEDDLERDPGNGLTLLHLGETHNLLGNHGEAVQYYSRAIENGRLPREVESVCLQNLASALIKLKRYGEALEKLDAAERANSRLLGVYLLKASARFGMKDYEQAEAEIRRYLQKARHFVGDATYRLDFNPDIASALVLIAKCRFARGNNEGAKQALEEALRLDNNYDAHVLLAKLAFEQLRFADAVVHFEQALKISPEDERLHFELAKSYLACGEVARAIEVMTEATERGMGGSEFLKCLGILKIKAEDFEGAIEAYQAALAKDPSDEDARKKLAGLYHHLGMAEAALSVLNGCKHL